MSLYQSSLYEHLKENSELLYPGKNILSIIPHILGGDNYNKEKNSEESIFSPNHTNEKSGDNLVNLPSLDEDSEEKDYSLFSKENIASINQTNNKSRDNYSEEYDESLISKESIFFENQTNDKSRDNLFISSSFENNIIYDDSLILKDNILFPNPTDKKRENLFNLTSLDIDIKKYNENLNSKDNILPPNINNKKSKNKIDNSFKDVPDISSQNNISTKIASNNKQINELKLFSITSLKKRGRRKTKKDNQKSHDSSSEDNCLLKIQNHFFNFIINLANEALQKENIIDEFILVDYNIKKNVKHDFFCKLKKYSIKSILEMDTSSKYRSRTKDFNRETLNKIKYYSNYSNWLEDFFNINYLDLFSEYHNNEKPKLKFYFKGKEIELSKAKSFYYLINKDKKIAKDLSNIAKRFFIDDNSTLNKILFQTKDIIDLKNN
jgi:hypothetical protein